MRLLSAKTCFPGGVLDFRTPELVDCDKIPHRHCRCCTLWVVVGSEIRDSLGPGRFGK